MKYSFYSDPSHGWLKVSIQEIEQLAITQDISSDSFISSSLTLPKKYLSVALNFQVSK